MMILMSAATVAVSRQARKRRITRCILDCCPTCLTGAPQIHAFNLSIGERFVISVRHGSGSPLAEILERWNRVPAPWRTARQGDVIRRWAGLWNE